MDPAQQAMMAAQQQAQQQAAAQQLAQQQRQPQQQQQPQLYQPQQISQLNALTEEEKVKYKAGLETLWNTIQTSAKGSPEWTNATTKVREFSAMLHNKIARRRIQMAQSQQARQAQQGQQAQQPQSQPGQQQQQQQQQQQAQQIQRPSAQQQSQQPQAQPAQMQQPNTQAQARPVPVQQQRPVGQVPLPQQPQQAQQHPGAPLQQRPSVTGPSGAQPQPTQTPIKLPDHVANHIKALQFKPQPQLNRTPEETLKWQTEMKLKYGRALVTIENGKARIQAWEANIARRTQAGTPLNDEEKQKMDDQKRQQLKVLNDARQWVEQFRKQNIVEPAPQQLQAAQSTANPQSNNVTPQPNMQTPAQQSVPANTAVNAAVEAAKNQQQMQPQNRPSPMPANVQTPVNRPVQNIQQPAQQQTQNHMQPQTQSQPQQAPVNNALANQQGNATPNMTQNQNQGVQRVQTPQASTPVNSQPAGPTRALSHQDAMSIANRRATTGNTPQVQQQQTVSTPSSAGGTMPGQQTQQQQHHQQQIAPQQQQQQHGHPHAHPTQQQATMQSKMPIPKVLPEKATAIPQGVNLGGGVKPGRPTLSQSSGAPGGVMNQAIMQRIPTYNNEAEGDHVLSKKKLDELVRQVHGASSEGQGGNLLTPEVEENVLSIADSFVDSVLHAACRNAKERGSKTLEIRDIQLVLERTYNIRVPGYSSDELRTVRKVQPSAGWIAKMSAVQAAKVMPGKGE